MNLKTLGAITAPFLMLSSAAEAATLAQYLYDANSSSESASSVLSGVTAGNLNDSTFDINDYRNTNFGSASLPSGFYWKVANHNVDASTDITDTGTPTTSYLGFTLSASNVGESLTFDTFSFEWGSAKDGSSARTSGDQNYRLFYSIDGGTNFTHLGTGSLDYSITNVPGDGTYIAPTVNVDISSIGAQSGDVEFRLYSWSVDGAANTATLMRNFEFTGAAVPEPTSSALIGLAGITFLLRRRR
ncbi:PEP-CTERM sorting domain-containing protein [Rubritalea squalenifaciens]|nr:PEP-CTERM sorting domain-containing protein [Rubritalea squalenifaciens]